MPIRLFAAVVAVILMVGFLAPVVLKLKEVALGAVISIGIAMMLVDLAHSLKSKED